MESDSHKKKPIQELLASKKKEKPGQEFFKTFSDQVLTRLEEPTPKPTIWERLNEKVDPIRAIAAIFAVAIGSTLIFALDEGSSIVETENNPLDQVDSRIMIDITKSNLDLLPIVPLSKSKNNDLAEFGISNTLLLPNSFFVFCNSDAVMSMASSQETGTNLSRPLKFFLLSRF